MGIYLHMRILDVLLTVASPNSSGRRPPDSSMGACLGTIQRPTGSDSAGFRGFVVRSGFVRGK